MAITMFEPSPNFTCKSEIMDLPYGLTAVEYDELINASNGLTMIQAGKESRTGRDTIKERRRRAMSKMGTSNTAGAVGKAIRERIIPVDKIHPNAQFTPLAPRQYEVFELIAEGMSDKAIAERLYITIGTVLRHVKRILHKLDAENRVHAVRRGYEYGVLELPELVTGNRAENNDNVIPIGIGQVAVESAYIDQADSISPAA